MAKFQGITNLTYDCGFKINGVPLPDPRTYSYSDEDLDAEGATRSIATGLLTRKKITSKYRLTIAWEYLNEPDINKIVGELQKEKFEFTLPILGGKGKFYTGSFYCSKRNPVCFKYDDAESISVWSLTCDIIEF